MSDMPAILHFVFATTYIFNLSASMKTAINIEAIISEATLRGCWVTITVSAAAASAPVCR